MYRRRAFAETDLAALDRLAARDAFATLVTVVDGAPVVSHLPVLYRREGEAVELRGHWSRANPQWRRPGPALAILHGPHAYVSPGWYADKEPEARVPTWNYAVAHLSGELSVHEDAGFLGSVVTGLSDVHEAAIGGDWRFDLSEARFADQLRGIVGFRLAVSSVEMSFKLSQNHPVANVEGAAAALSDSAREADREIAGLMRHALQQRTEGNAP